VLVPSGTSGMHSTTRDGSLKRRAKKR
jgi:hypothetical protein